MPASSVADVGEFGEFCEKLAPVINVKLEFHWNVTGQRE